MKSNCKGNVLVYILVAVALFAALTYAVSGDNRGTRHNQLSDARVDLLSTNLIKQVTSANMALYQMTQWGIDYNDVMFDVPGSASYTTNVSRQIHHPSGGGLAMFQTSDDMFDGAGTTGWQFQGNTNIGWSPTTATDLIYSFVNVNADVCAAINEQLLNDPTIPTTTVNFTNTFTENGTDANFVVGECAACEGVKSMCISDGSTYAFYSTIGMR
jgi:hypothetical protein